jgi:hypothetical protein
MKPQDNPDVENALIQIAPSIPAGLRDRMLFAAGQQAAQVTQRQAFRWQLGTTAAVTGLLTFALTWMFQPVLPSRISESIATNTNSSSTESSGSLSDNLTNRQSAPASQTKLSTTARFFTLHESFQDSLLNGEQIQPISNTTMLTPRSSLDL